MSFIYSNQLIDFKKEPIFFGTGRNSQRYDNVKYKKFEKLLDSQNGQFWQHNEVNVVKDQADFQFLTEAEKHVFTRTLNKLIFLDSVQGRGMLQTFGTVISDPMFEAMVTAWQHFECTIHSRSYTHILQSIYPNPGDIFDESFKIAELTELAEDISTQYENCFNAVTRFNLNQNSLEDTKEKILRLILEINILEGIRFYSGFAAIWAMGELGKMERTGLILDLICRDENLHLAMTQNLLKILEKNEDEGFTKTYKKLKPEIPKIYERAAEQEFLWIDYLFSKGSFLGLTPDLAKSYIKYLTNRRLKAIGEKIIFEGFNSNPFPWVDKHISSDSSETLPQENEIINYRDDILSMSIDDNDILKLKKKFKIN